MNFRTVKTAIETLLINNQGSNFRTIGNQRNRTRADDALDNNRTVQVYYQSGSFPKNKGSMSGDNEHEMTFRLEFTVSKKAEADLTVLDPASIATPAEKVAAIAAAKPAAQLADASMDELFDLVYQIIMDARNQEFGIDSSHPIVADRWIDNFEKGDTIPQGDLVVLSGQATLTCSTLETVSGETPVVPSPAIFDTNIENTRDNTETGIINTGVKNEN